jgi:hypothetical protein
MGKRQNCLECGGKLEGRSDKKFCDDYCRAAWHFKTKEKLLTFRNIDHQLKKNRKILKNFNKAGKAVIRADILLNKRFNPRFFTHYWKAGNGNVYFFCYEFGFLRKKENQKEKYVLIHMQKYMMS